MPVSARSSEARSRLSHGDARATPRWPGARLCHRRAYRRRRLRRASSSTKTVSSIALPARAHAPVLMRDAGAALLVGRRPGTFAAVVDLEAPEAPARMFHPIAGHRFVGHAAINGDALFTTEIDAETGEGAAVLRDCAFVCTARALRGRHRTARRALRARRRGAGGRGRWHRARGRRERAPRSMPAGSKARSSNSIRAPAPC